MSSTARKNQMNGSADEVEAAFYDAFGRADIDAMMACWAEDEDIICVHPGSGRIVGPAAVRAAFLAIFERGAIKIHASQVYAIKNMMCAMHNVIEDVQMPDDGDQDIHIVSTNVYIKTPKGWRIIAHHASVAAGPDDYSERFDAGHVSDSLH